MKLTKSQLKQIVKEELINIIEEALTPEEEEILDIGPSHPQYNRVARKARRSSGGYSGPGADWSRRGMRGSGQSSYASMAQDMARQSQIDVDRYERGKAAVDEPMIAMGLDPTDGMDRFRFMDMTKCAKGLQGHLEKFLEMEKKAIERLLAAQGKEGHREKGFERQIRQIRMDMYELLLSSGAYKCRDFSPALLLKLVDIQASLRPMPAYTPGEAEKELKDRNINIKHEWKKVKLTKSEIGQIIKEELEEVYSEKQRKWACAQTGESRKKFKGKLTLSPKEAEEMCKDVDLKKAKDKK